MFVCNVSLNACSRLLFLFVFVSVAYIAMYVLNRIWEIFTAFVLFVFGFIAEFLLLFAVA